MIDPIRETLKLQLNPFLVAEVKQFLNEITTENWQSIRISDHFPELI